MGPLGPHAGPGTHPPVKQAPEKVGKHPKGRQTPERLADTRKVGNTRKVGRHPKGRQTPERKADIRRVGRHPRSRPFLKTQPLYRTRCMCVPMGSQGYPMISYGFPRVPMVFSCFLYGFTRLL